MSSTDAADMSDTITVVIPTFNRAGMLRRALASVLEEQRVPIKVTVLDNASTDDTAAVVAELLAHDPRITYIRNEVNLGSIGNYTKGLATVTTRYFIPLADDDFLLPGFVHEAYGIMQRDRTLGATVFSTEQRNAAGQVTTRYPSSPDHLTLGRLMPTEHLREWMSYGHYAWSSVLWNADVLRTVGFPYLHIGLPSDVDFQAQIFCHFPAFLVDKPGAVFYEHPGQASSHFSITQLRSWAELFARLDRSVAKSKILDEAEYAPLRDIMWRRYRWVWNIVPSVMPDAAEVAKAAAIAKTRLGDEELALRLWEYARLHGVAEIAVSTAAATVQECDEPAAEPHVTYARNGEDIVLWRALGAVKGGYYVDIGAGDPTRHSVTKIFYDRGWCGVNVERARARHEILVRERARDLSLQLILVAKSDAEPLLPKLSEEPGDTPMISYGPAATLTQLLASLPAREIHFLRLGFASNATRLLEGIDLCPFRPWVILVSAVVPGCNGLSVAWEQPWRNYGYLRALSDGHNIFFVAEEHRDLLGALCAAPSDGSARIAPRTLKRYAVASPMLRLICSGFVARFGKPALGYLRRFMIRLGA
jgi:glycosyltransferase involved in cell wall biosynthesis